MITFSLLLKPAARVWKQREMQERCYKGNNRDDWKGEGKIGFLDCCESDGVAWRNSRALLLLIWGDDSGKNQTIGNDQAS